MVQRPYENLLSCNLIKNIKETDVRYCIISEYNLSYIRKCCYSTEFLVPGIVWNTSRGVAGQGHPKTETPKTVQVLACPFDCPPELEDKALLLKTSHSSPGRYKESKINPNRKAPCWLSNARQLVEEGIGDPMQLGTRWITQSTCMIYLPIQ